MSVVRSSSGTILFLLDLADETKDESHFVTGKEERAIDLMQGAAGEGLALLRLATLDVKVDPVRHLPDRAVRDR